jgi:hypothetical protein
VIGAMVCEMNRGFHMPQGMIYTALEMCFVPHLLWKSDIAVLKHAH